MYNSVEELQGKIEEKVAIVTDEQFSRMEKLLLSVNKSVHDLSEYVVKSHGGLKAVCDQTNNNVAQDFTDSMATNKKNFDSINTALNGMNNKLNALNLNVTKNTRRMSNNQDNQV